MFLKVWCLEILISSTSFQNIKIKLNSRTWMTLKSSVVICQALEPLQPQGTPKPKTTSMTSMTFTASFHQKNTAPDGWILPGNQMTNTDPFLWHGSSKTQIFTDIWSFSIKGCWGQPILVFWKLFDEIKISKPQDFKTTFKKNSSLHYSICQSIQILQFIMRYPVQCT